MNVIIIWLLNPPPPPLSADWGLLISKFTNMTTLYLILKMNQTIQNGFPAVIWWHAFEGWNYDHYKNE